MNDALIKKIESMDANEWKEYRNTSWKNKKNSFAVELPDWYLKSKESYMEFIDKTNAKLTKSKKGFKPKILSDDIKQFDEKRWNEYRKDMWVKKSTKFASDIPPHWYLTDKNKYVSFLKKQA